MRKHVDDQDENQRPGENAGCLGSIAWPEKTARAVRAVLGEDRPGRLWGRSGSVLSRESRPVTTLPQAGVETPRKVRRLPLIYPHGSTGTRRAGDDCACRVGCLNAGRLGSSPVRIPPGHLRIGRRLEGPRAYRAGASASADLIAGRRSGGGCGRLRRRNGCSMYRYESPVSRIDTGSPSRQPSARNSGRWRM